MQTLSLELARQLSNTQSCFLPCTVRIIVFTRSFEMMIMNSMAHSRSPFWLNLLVNHHLLAIQSSVLIYGLFPPQIQRTLWSISSQFPLSSLSSFSALSLPPHFHADCISDVCSCHLFLLLHWEMGWELSHLFWGPQCIAHSRCSGNFCWLPKWVLLSLSLWWFLLPTISNHPKIDDPSSDLLLSESQ